MLTLDDAPPRVTSARRRPRAVVIGSGFGGLAAAVRLGARGYRVSVLERLDQPGGRARVHRQDGFTFDAGPTIVTAPFLFEDLWALCGRRLSDDVTLVPMRPFYRIRFDDGATFAMSGDPAAMRDEVERLSPGEAPAYDRFMALSDELCRVGFEQLGAVPFGRVTDMLRIAPDLLRLGGHRSVYSLVSSVFRDERLRTAFSFHPLLIGGSPFRASALYCLIASLERRWGVHSALGGTGALVRGLVRLIEGQGGEVRCGSEVARILVEDGTARGVALADGTAIRADIVVSNADSVATALHLLPPEVRGRGSRRLARAHSSMGLFVWYFGTRRTYPELPHHTIVLGPRYRGLLDDIFSRKVLAEDMSLYLHRPTATDPSVAPPGHDAFYVLAPVPNLAGGQDWAALAEPYRQRIAARLEATVLPGLSDALATSRVTTPQDFSDDFLAFRGSGFGLEPILTQSAYFRPHNRCGAVRHLYLVGAGTHPGAGLPGVLSSSKILDRVVPDAAVFA
ncbi:MULTISPECIES: phytoene desaturase family protein [Methylobacterium]|jgi:phytoene desaturase|uniref:Phytoene dehydrogenase n=2 Tax=Methylobacterium TaxID=407 RepID=A0A0C6F6A2_9HYPH|nr:MULTISPECIES: phytoene desaturase family protein [Methylobacterium]MBZ6414261.1 phytoene desaturase [Methylobacterium sp.]MBK3398350.1 phytoene desaturase [Methylobacterium ajmalii]MBK3408433.1 phytoene desaturase [Methylobacterium ajmalii]MBK3426416.1 phytoene desaturase [Methylobacterium ajmalii]SFE47200.1 phytoene desaturase [Methylobacterium sp. yr596]